MKLVVRLFLSFCLFLLGGLNFLGAHTHQAPVRPVIDSHHVSTGILASLQFRQESSFSAARSGIEKQRHRIHVADTEDEEEDEDEDRSSFQLCSGSPNYFTTLLHIPGIFTRNTFFGTGYPSQKDFFASNAPRYIFCRVIRI